MRVLSNFLCNGVSGAKGEVLSKEKLDRMGEQVNALIKLGCIEMDQPVAPAKKEDGDFASAGKKESSKK